MERIVLRQQTLDIGEARVDVCEACFDVHEARLYISDPGLDAI